MATSKLMADEKWCEKRYGNQCWYSYMVDDAIKTVVTAVNPCLNPKSHALIISRFGAAVTAECKNQLVCLLLDSKPQYSQLDNSESDSGKLVAVVPCFKFLFLNLNPV